MGAYSAYCPTRIGILLELLFPINLFVCVAFLFVWLAYNPRYIWVPAAALILSWGGIARYCPIHKPKAPDNSQPGFTLMTYNVYHMLDHEGKGTSQNRTLSLLLKQNADLVCLQESPELASPNRGLKISEAQIDSIHAIYPYRIPTSLNMNFLSKYPAELLFDTVYSESSAFAAYRVQIEGHEVTIINQHMESIGLTQTDKELYHEITAHPSTNSLDEVKELLLSKLINAARARNKQADLTAERIVIHLMVFVIGIIPDIVHMDLDQPLLLGPFQYRLVQRTDQQLRHNRKNIYAHGSIHFSYGFTFEPCIKMISFSECPASGTKRPFCNVKSTYPCSLKNASIATRVSPPVSTSTVGRKRSIRGFISGNTTPSYPSISHLIRSKRVRSANS